jgi:3-hydroxyacyl-[acyl-carrier-protein] dehydratase
MLLKTFFTYQLIEKTEESISVALQLNKEHDIYKGHFPQMPITPGVCQVQLLKEVLELELGKGFLLESAKDIKFINMINPNEIANIQLDIKYKDVDDKHLQVSGVIFQNEVKFLKIRANFCEK